MRESSSIKNNWLEKAFHSALQAVEYYPGSSQFRMNLASIAQQLDKNDIALEQYKKAIEIEDAYRLQFEKMYPGKEFFSRLGRENYQLAKQKIEQLSKH